MKRLILCLLMVCAGWSASAMGHPHNLFSAHRKAQQHSPKTVGCQRSACRQASSGFLEYVRAVVGA